MFGAPPINADLVARFDNDATHYRVQPYNETQTNIDFDNHLCKALGWAMDNAAGYADAYRYALQRQIDATDAWIDSLGCDLYGLTEDEIQFVEESTAG